MKICREINYEDFGITEETGWTVSYDWKKLNAFLKKLGIIVNIFLACCLAILVNTVFKEEYKVITILLSVAISVFIFLFVLTPIHEILHLIPMAGFKFDDNCHILIGKATVSAFYAGEISKKQHCISLITPLLALGLILLVSIIFLSGVFQMCAVFVLICHIGGCYTDIYMFFYINKNFPSKTIFYGNRYRTV